jgi:hypothetical protein
MIKSSNSLSLGILRVCEDLTYCDNQYMEFKPVYIPGVNYVYSISSVDDGTSFFIWAPLCSVTGQIGDFDITNDQMLQFSVFRGILGVLDTLLMIIGTWVVPIIPGRVRAPFFS